MDIAYETRRAAKRGLSLEDSLKQKAAKSANVRSIPLPKHSDPIEELASKMAAQPEAICFLVRHGQGTVSGALLARELALAINTANANAANQADARGQAIDWVRTTISKNRHLIPDNGSAVIATAAWLVATSQMAPDTLKPGSGFILNITNAGDTNRLEVIGLPRMAPEQEVDSRAVDVSGHDRRGHWRNLRSGKRVWVRESEISTHSRQIRKITKT